MFYFIYVSNLHFTVLSIKLVLLIKDNKEVTDKSEIKMYFIFTILFKFVYLFKIIC